MEYFLIKREDVCDIGVPDKIDISSSYKYRVINQRNIQMCKICAWILCIEYMRQIDNLDYMTFSIPFLYHYARIKDEDPFLNVPVSSNSIISTLIEKGACEDCYHVITEQAIQNAEQHKEFVVFEKLEPCTETLKYILGICMRPIVCDISINIRNFPAVIDSTHGGKDNHCVLLVGYIKDHFIFQNSYGITWGNNGFGMIHISFINSGYMNECYSIPTSCIKSDLIK